MFDLTPEKIFILGIVALVVLGPNRLPSAARSLGKLIGQLRALTTNLQTEVREAVQLPDNEFTSALTEFRPADIRRSVRRSITDTLAPPVASSAPTAANGSAAVVDAFPTTAVPPTLTGPGPVVGAAGTGQAPGPAGWPGAAGAFGAFGGGPGTPDDPAFN